MNVKIKLVIATVTLMVLFLNPACKKDEKKDGICETLEQNDGVDSAFCSLVDDSNFNATGVLIDGFLAGLHDSMDENLGSLVDWLECKNCVEEAAIICNSCIYTNPPQSEISVDFISNGQEINLTLDIIMGDPLKFREFH